MLEQQRKMRQKIDTTQEMIKEKNLTEMKTKLEKAQEKISTKELQNA